MPPEKSSVVTARWFLRFVSRQVFEPAYAVVRRPSRHKSERDRLRLCRLFGPRQDQTVPDRKFRAVYTGLALTAVLDWRWPALRAGVTLRDLP